jgi:hypothetical protein
MDGSHGTHGTLPPGFLGHHDVTYTLCLQTAGIYGLSDSAKVWGYRVAPRLTLGRHAASHLSIYRAL